MHSDKLHLWQHNHIFEQDQRRAGETRTLIVVAITALMMVVEIAAGLAYGSMALLADGLHMASHAAALGIAAFAYYLSRRLAKDRRFSFGVGKINSLAGYTSALLLLGFSLLMLAESADRLLHPEVIAFDQALVVATLGLVVNAGCAWILIASPEEHNHHGHSHGHQHHHDHNLRAAYLHVLADALTSGLAIAALLAGKFLGAGWLDPAMGIVGALLVARWSWSLIRDCLAVLLDWQADRDIEQSLREAVESDSNDRVADLHCWSIGHGLRAAELVVISHTPAPPDHYRARIPARLNIVHATIEVHRCED